LKGVIVDRRGVEPHPLCLPGRAAHR